MLTGIGLQNIGHGALFAQVRGPMQLVGFQQAALLHIASAKIIGKKMPAFFTGRGDHV